MLLNTDFNKSLRSQHHGQQPTTTHQAGWHYSHLMTKYEEK